MAFNTTITVTKDRSSQVENERRVANILNTSISFRKFLQNRQKRSRSVLYPKAQKSSYIYARYLHSNVSTQRYNHHVDRPLTFGGWFCPFRFALSWFLKQFTEIGLIFGHLTHVRRFAIQVRASQLLLRALILSTACSIFSSRPPILCFPGSPTLEID